MKALDILREMCASGNIWIRRQEFNSQEEFEAFKNALEGCDFASLIESLSNLHHESESGDHKMDMFRVNFTTAGKRFFNLDSKKNS